ncbi:MAG TPA: PAS domain S-box protein, partial [Rhizobacter sp.]|nr:PAS domain S-box protein [Rhizobacter sp.]
MNLTAHHAFAFDVDLMLAFDLAPVGLCLLRNRVIQRCNETYASMFGYEQDELIGESMALLYPSEQEFVNLGARGLQTMLDCGRYSDERIMKHHNGQLFWCHASGRALDRDDPYGCSVWMFDDISYRRPITTALTTRER